ncbi:2-oxoglutarate dehydrogenase E1 component [Alteraurantiacibacter aquimixticola]|uniref:2-oxoglutarate dehydrogenase E1 component n=1 Tax=Alteraurantiacibacter aquimixticola TaxID=2489173 RepID=A0A4T3F6C1_9SPHN|nr:2-oxoglutarate dehydrogenase E1 component [Alteraurantiacibacter aquimixticola]TIX50406.1 2-oxoglutarate dehydrogenase E1 component [Alteraurantiacibacter aquimixticola]
MGNEAQNFLPELADQDGPQPGPSWANAKWPLSDDGGDMADAMDPTTMTLAVKEAAAKAGKVMDSATIEQAADASIRAMMLIRLYRVRGHLAANLDPLGLSHLDMPEELTLKWHGFDGQEDKEVYVGGAFGFEWVTVGELYQALRSTYCGDVGLEYMHISDTAERRFLQDRFEGPDTVIQFTPEGKRAMLGAVIRGEEYEKFLGRKYVGTKRFGLDGGESMIPALEAVIKYGGATGVREIVYGMAHRGRLNVLANVMAKPYKVIFHEFSGGSANPDDVGGSGDVKYHLGTSTDREFDGIKVHMSLVPNPSHLEAVNPVVLGKVRAQQAIRDDLSKHEQVLPVLIHGDAAFAGQGVVWECFGLSGVRGYSTGGCIHFVINNQIGFTTSPKFARSSPYPSDVAKGVQAPILHVNGDNPEAVTFACKLAVEYRQKFKRDIVIDMWCYRRFGHNEGDEPMFTQPLMYAEIKKHPRVSEAYSERLKKEGVIEEGTAPALRDEFIALLEEEFEAGKSYKPNEADWFAGRWSGLHKPADPETARRNVHTAIEKKLFESLGRTLTSVPDDLTIHKTLQRVLDAKKAMFETGEGFDWATAEALAFGSLVTEGFGVRLSGQDSGRGTFSQRHAIWVDQKTEEKYIPLATLPHGKFEVYDSTLSEFGVLGFEYGFALADPKTLVMWEAQFGDFANGAQIMIDQFIASGEAKWLRANGLVMLLPHGFEGQGPEHSSARLERFLQLCANDNIQVCNITSPANYFHVLRRQMMRSFRKPLVIMTPKSLLRHPLAKSDAQFFMGDSHFMRILSDKTEIADTKVKRLVLCSGKVAYDLMEKRDEEGVDDVSVVRLEQLYPFPGEPLAVRLKRMTNLEEVVWCQEEPKNNGAWFFVESRIEEALIAAGHKGMRPSYAGREPAASPATGFAKRHQAQQEALVSIALGLSERGKSAAKAKSTRK